MENPTAVTGAFLELQKLLGTGPYDPEESLPNLLFRALNRLKIDVDIRARLEEDIRQTLRNKEALHEELIECMRKNRKLEQALEICKAERDTARREWSDWMKLAVGQGRSLGIEHAPTVEGVPSGK